jgi:RimJ/RimL family protein N-acetyltransferase
MIIREMQREIDGERLADFDASFSTEYIYRVTVDKMSVEITEEKLDVPFQKTYPFDLIKKDIDGADYAVVAEIDKIIAGFASVKYEEWNNRACLTGIFVVAESKGKGVGHALAEAAKNFAKTKSARCLWAETQNVNYPAIQFYRKNGFEFCGFDNALYNPADVSPEETAFYFRKLLPVKILETERTIIREVCADDAEFIFDLLNQPSFIKYIGDRNVRTVTGAVEYIESRFANSYRQFGFGMYAVELKETGTPIGICGFVKRDYLPDADIGFAFLPQYCSKGYAFESANGMMSYGRDVLGLNRVLAITSQDNESSGKLLEKINFKFDSLIKLPNSEEELKLFSSDA